MEVTQAWGDRGSGALDPGGVSYKTMFFTIVGKRTDRPWNYPIVLLFFLPGQQAKCSGVPFHGKQLDSG